jgi:hypothetical protein
MDTADSGICGSDIFNTVSPIPKAFQRISHPGHRRLDFQYLHLERNHANVWLYLLFRDADDEHLYFSDVYH